MVVCEIVQKKFTITKWLANFRTPKISKQLKTLLMDTRYLAAGILFFIVCSGAYGFFKQEPGSPPSRHSSATAQRLFPDSKGCVPPDDNGNLIVSLSSDGLHIEEPEVLWTKHKTTTLPFEWKSNPVKEMHSSLDSVLGESIFNSIRGKNHRGFVYVEPGAAPSTESIREIFHTIKKQKEIDQFTISGDCDQPCPCIANTGFGIGEINIHIFFSQQGAVIKIRSGISSESVFTDCRIGPDLTLLALQSAMADQEKQILKILKAGPTEEIQAPQNGSIEKSVQRDETATGNNFFSTDASGFEQMIFCLKSIKGQLLSRPSKFPMTKFKDKIAIDIRDVRVATECSMQKNGSKSARLPLGLVRPTQNNRSYWVR